jgi:hypothetical protein
MSTEQSVAATDAPAKYFGLTDGIFVVIALVVGVMVSHLGYTTYKEGVKTEATKAHGEALAAWLEQHGAARAEGKAGDVAACDAKDATWKDCAAALQVAGAPFEGLSNVAEKEGKLFSVTCDHNDPETHGALILEKGVPKAPPNSGFDYAPLADSEALNAPLPMRVSICGRAFSLIRIKEVLF